MKKLLAILGVGIAFAISGCSQQVPPGFKGKILGPSGYSAEVLAPGKHVVGFRENLILLDTSTNATVERVKMKTADDLDLSFDVKIRSRIGGSDGAINAMFSDIRQQNGKVEFSKVYATYLRDIVRSKAREVLSGYKIQDVNQNYARINQELQRSISQAAKATPLQVTSVLLGSINYPKVITDAIELQKQRELDIKRIEAEQEATIRKKEAELVNTRKQQEIDILKAESVRDQNKIVAAGINPMLLEYRRLEVQEKMANQLGNDGSVVFYPYGAGGSTGLQNRIYQK